MCKKAEIKTRYTQKKGYWGWTTQGKVKDIEDLGSKQKRERKRKKRKKEKKERK